MPDKPALLFLAHRIPYPPNKGDKIRSWNVLRELSEHFEIYLGTFVDDPDDWKYVPVLRESCRDVFVVARHPGLHKLLSARALLTGAALSISFYASGAMQRWVDTVVRRHTIERAYAFCSPMVQFVMPSTIAGTALKRVVLDFVDVDSEKWRQYAQAGTGLATLLYAREARCLLDWEATAANTVSRGFFVSSSEASLFRMKTSCDEGTVGYFSNGVDASYFQPDPGIASPYPEDVLPIVFTGAMDYAPNEDAVCWFVDEVLGQLQDFANLQLWIVGGRPGARVRQLASSAPVVVTGRVPDVRPFLQHASVAIAPMRIARGIQNKVLEAMAMDTPVVASTSALEGLEAVADAAINGGDTPEAFTQAVRRVLSASAPPVSSRGRLLSKFSWSRNVAPVVDALR